MTFQNLRKTWLLLIPLLCYLNAFAQYENHIWLFGPGPTSIQFDLTSNQPRPYSENHHILRGEQATTATDPSTGVLLFYADGTNIYNREHDVMTEGAKIFICESSAQAVAIVPKLESNNQYYVFFNTLGAGCAQPGKITYCVVDMSLNQGLGEIIEPEKILLENVHEGLLTIPKSCQEDGFLLLGLRNSDEESHFVFEINESGINKIQSIKLFEENQFGNYNLAFSETRDQFAFTRIGKNQVGTINFNLYQGQFKDSVVIIDTLEYLYDVEYSPDGSKLYYSSLKNIELRQYDLQTRKITTIFKNDDPELEGGGLETGPDGRIYHINNRKSSSLGVIHNPDQPGEQINYNPIGLEVGHAIEMLNLPEVMTVRPAYEESNPQPNGTIINQYGAVKEICENRLMVSSASLFQEGDSVLIIQMKGIEIDTTNSENFGKVLNYNNAGQYEFNKITAIEDNQIILEYSLIHEFDVKNQVQIVDVPDLGNGSIGPLTCRPWDGQTGGILAFSGGDLVMNGNLDVSGMGFRGGKYIDSLGIGCAALTNYFFEKGQLGTAGEKGEGAIITRDKFFLGRGAIVNGGGGGNEHNSGGGGGGNAGGGGRGAIFNCTEIVETYGLGGYSLIEGIQQNRVFLGGGGGGGHANDGRGSDGGNGGGIIFILAKTFSSNGFEIKSDGISANRIGPKNCLNDGGGGGGAGGTILINLKEPSETPLSVSVSGGNGASVHMDHGHGGGGGGGVFLVNDYSLTMVNLTFFGGSSGIGVDWNARGATGGGVGKILNRVFPPQTKTVFNQLRIEELNVNQECDGTGSIHISTNKKDGNTEFRLVDSHDWQPSGNFSDLKDGTYLVQIRNNCFLLDTLITIENIEPLQTELLVNIPIYCHTPSLIEWETTGGKGEIDFSTNNTLNWQPGSFLETFNTDLQLIRIRDERNCMDSINVEVTDDSYVIQIEMPTKMAVEKGLPFEIPIEIFPNNEPVIAEWNPNEGLSCFDCLIPNFTPKFSTDYSLRVEDYLGCEGTSNVSVIIKDSKIELPNSFSPNGNGNNDVFYLQSKEGLVKVIRSFLIFDRWGNQLFNRVNINANDAAAGWNGKVNGVHAPTGTYVYKLEIEKADGTIDILKGGFILVR